MASFGRVLRCGAVRALWNYWTEPMKAWPRPDRNEPRNVVTATYERVASELRQRVRHGTSMNAGTRARLRLGDLRRDRLAVVVVDDDARHRGQQEHVGSRNTPRLGIERSMGAVSSDIRAHHRAEPASQEMRATRRRRVTSSARGTRTLGERCRREALGRSCPVGRSPAGRGARRAATRRLAGDPRRQVSLGGWSAIGAFGIYVRPRSSWAPDQRSAISSAAGIARAKLAD
jgi:hypothetical protein